AETASALVTGPGVGYLRPRRPGLGCGDAGQPRLLGVADDADDSHPWEVRSCAAPGDPAAHCIPPGPVARRQRFVDDDTRLGPDSVRCRQCAAANDTGTEGLEVPSHDV